MKARQAFLWAAVLLGLSLPLLAGPAYSAGGSSDLLVVPDILHITESFRGASVSISAEVPKGAGAIVEVMGPVQDDHLLRQGRRGGLWMSVGEVAVHGAPSAYLLLSTPDLTTGRDCGAQSWYAALQKRIEFDGSLPERGVGALFDQFVKLKESEGLYGVFPNSLKLASTSGDRSKVEGQFRLPSNIEPGNYRITLSAINSGKVVDQRSFELPVEMRGLPALLISLARQYSLVYGLMAVLVALLTGFVMGLLFKSKGSH